MLRRSPRDPPPRTRLLVASLVLLGAGHARPASACSYHFLPEPGGIPTEGAVLGELPLLVGAADEHFSLQTEIGAHVTLEEIAVDELEGVEFPYGYYSLPVKLLRPASPLPEGEYWWYSGAGTGARFTVAAGAVIDPPTLGRPAPQLIAGGSDSRGTGCVPDDCPPLGLPGTILFPKGGDWIRGQPNFLVSVTNSSVERARTVLVRHSLTPQGDRVITFVGNDLTPSSDAPWCVTLRTVALDGSVSPSIDLGCIDLSDPDDPRMLGTTNEGGCHTIGAGAAQMQVTLLGALAALLTRRRARHATTSTPKGSHRASMLGAEAPDLEGQ